MQKTDTGPSWAQSLVSPQMSLNKFPSPYAILKNIIIRSKYDASARPQKSTLEMKWSANIPLVSIVGPSIYIVFNEI